MEYYRLTIPIPKQPWRWIRYRISTMLLLVALLATSLAWRRDHNKLTEQLFDAQHPLTNWGIRQITGPPNTKGYGDIVTAWASASPDDQEEWLVLDYEKSVRATAIVIHETHSPGAVYKVTHLPKWGKERILWEGADPTPVTLRGGVSRLPLTAKIRTGRIKVYINSPAVPGYNEIDAVGLEYGKGEVIWVKRASASSSYGDDNLTTRGPNWVATNL